MASASSPIGHNGAGALHHRFPVGVGHVSHQHIARLHLVHLRNAVNQSDWAGANFLANGSALRQNGALAFELVAQLGRALRLTFHCLWTCLQNIKQAIGAVLAPLNVHGAAVVLFNDHGILRQLGNVGICQGVTVAQLHGHIDGFHQLAGSCFFLGC